LSGKIDARHHCARSTGINNIGIVGNHADVAAFHPADCVPVLKLQTLAEAGGAARQGKTIVLILLGSVDSVGDLIIRDYTIDLRGWLVQLSRPRLSSVHRDGSSAIVAFDHYLRVFRVDPEIVIVAVWHGNRVESFSTVRGSEEISIGGVDHVRIFGIGKDVPVIPRAPEKGALRVDADKALSSIVRTEHTSVRGVHQCPYTIWHGRRDVDAYSSYWSLRESPRQLSPMVAAIRSFENSTIGRSSHHSPRVARSRPQGGVHHIGVLIGHH